MNPLQWAVSISIVSGVAAREGFSNAVGVALLLVLVTTSWRVVLGGRRMREANGSRLARRRDQRVAEWIITSYSAAFGSDGARSLAMEAGELLDEMIHHGASRHEIIDFVWRFLFNMPGQLPRRHGSPAPPTVEVSPPNERDLLQEGARAYRDAATARFKRRIREINEYAATLRTPSHHQRGILRGRRWLWQMKMIRRRKRF